MYYKLCVCVTLIPRGLGTTLQTCVIPLMNSYSENLNCSRPRSYSLDPGPIGRGH